jgi:hypothetical protein
MPGPSRPRTVAHPSAAGTRASERDPVAGADARTVVDKAVRVPHFEIAVRFAVAAEAAKTPPSPERATQIRERLAGLGHTIASAAAAYTGPNRLRRMKMPHPVATLAGRRLRRGFLATVPELAALAALPQDLAVPGLDRARAKAVPAPVQVTSGGRGVKVLGRSQVGHHSVGFKVTDARQHLHVVGKTGVGKSTLLLNLILGDIKARRGTVVIDPRGDLITDILDRLPASYADKIVIIDPDQENPGCFNPLDDQGDPHLALATPSSRTCAAATTNSESTPHPRCGSRQHSPNSPKRSDRLSWGGPARPQISQCNRADRPTSVRPPSLSLSRTPAS